MLASHQRRAIPRTRLIGDQGRALLRDAANGAGLVIILVIALAVLFHLPTARAALQELALRVRAI